MRYFISLLAIALLFACAGTKTETKITHVDLLAFNIKGDVVTVEDSMFVIDSLGNAKPDSVYYELGKYEDGALLTYLSKDSAGPDTYAYYLHDSTGLFSGQYTVNNNKLIDSFILVKDSSGNVQALEYDSSRKLVNIIRDIKRSKYGLLNEGKNYSPDMKLTSSFVNKFENDVFRGYTTYDSAGKVEREMSSIINEHNDFTEEKTFTAKDSTTKTVKFRYDSYDETGNWTKRTELNEKDRPVKMIKRKYVYKTAK